MPTQTTPVVDALFPGDPNFDRNARNLRIARVLLEKASDTLDVLEVDPDVPPEVRARIGEVYWLVETALVELP